ncbi:MAG: ankyrin repeat domain-containing protein [Wolbachia sp.]
MLIQYNANVNAQVVKHYDLSADVLFTPLHLAVRNGHYNIVEILIKMEQILY